MPFPIFDRNRLLLRPLAEREHDMELADILPLDAPVPRYDNPDLERVAQHIADARANGRAVVLLMGAHVIKVGLSNYLIDLLRRDYLTHIAMNGAGPIHDFELALIGASTERVARYVRDGRFGLWHETGRINDAINTGARDGLGMGEAIGRMIHAEGFPHREASILAAGYRLGKPVTVHVGIGYDIIHEHPNCDGAALGATSYHDFLILAQNLLNLEGGVVLNVGTAVMGPEVYLKALSMARNVALQEGGEIRHFATAVFDLLDLGPDIHHEASKDDAHYYYRPYKTILVRTVADGGVGYYIRGDHRATIPNLYQHLIRLPSLSE